MLPLPIPSQSKRLNKLLQKRLALLQRWHKLLGDSEFYLEYALQMENAANYSEAQKYLKLAKHNIARYDRISRHIDRLTKRINIKEKN